MFVDPIAERIRLNFHPKIFVASNIHTFGSRTFRTAGDEAGVRDFLQIGGAVSIVLQQPGMGHLGILYVSDIHFFVFGAQSTSSLPFVVYNSLSSVVRFPLVCVTKHCVTKRRAKLKLISFIQKKSFSGFCAVKNGE